MKHRITAAVTFEFEVRDSSYPGVENPDDRLLIDIEATQDDPAVIADMLANGDVEIQVTGELVP